MMKKLLAAASVSALAITGANALEIDNVTVGGENLGDPAAMAYSPYLLASEIDFSAETAGVDASEGSILLQMSSTTGTFPTGNVLMKIDLTNATFDGNLNGDSVLVMATCPTGTAVRSLLGADGDASVTFVVSGIDSCSSQIDLLLPVDVTASGAVSVTVNLTTEQGSQLDVSSASVVAVDAGDGYSFTFTPSSNPVAQLPDFTTLDTGDADLGDIELTLGMGTYSDMSGTDVDAMDVDTGTIRLIGSNAGFASADITTETATGTALDGDISVTLSDAELQGLTTADDVTLFDAVGVDDAPISASDYSVTVTYDVFGNTVMETGSLASIDREGTQVVVPWVSSDTQGAASGSRNLIRVGNVTGTATGAVFVTALNWTNMVSGATVKVADSIPANGEVQIDSAQLEALLGDFGRGDIEVTVETAAGNVTVRRFIIRPTGIQGIDNGTVAQNN